jgi:hypothetical protein
MSPARNTRRRTRPRSLAALALVALSLVATATALASHLDPQKRYTPADQARARAMLLRAADLGPGTRSQANPPDPHTTCKGLDQSDLVLSGKARGKSYARGVTVYGSNAEVYATLADSKAAWRRSTTRAALRCVEELYAREYAKQGLTLQSFNRRSFPNVAQETIAFRVVLTGEAQGITVPIALDIVGLRHTRAQAGLVFGSVSPPTRAEEARLARVIAARMATAMRAG